MMPEVILGKCQGCGVEARGFSALIYCLKCGQLWDAAWEAELRGLNKPKSRRKKR
jgi:hypothetical protein